MKKCLGKWSDTLGFDCLELDCPDCKLCVAIEFGEARNAVVITEETDPNRRVTFGSWHDTIKGTILILNETDQKLDLKGCAVIREETS